MKFLETYNEALSQHLKTAIPNKEPKQLYEPIEYIVGLGGKRLRPILTLMTCDFFGTETEKAMNAALAIELFHNFSLIHDDIMDNAPFRRGKQTVHEKWNLNTGILSGDAMLIMAYRFFESYEPALFQELAKLFSETALKVCEGQQYDVDFETRDDVSLSEYLKMIDYKTAVLLGASMQMGAAVASASEENKKNCYDFGRNLGIAFQLQDDYLDVFGSPETFGKQVGGDIISNKKTFLYLTAIKAKEASSNNELLHLYSISPKDPTAKIERVRAIFETTGAANEILREINSYTEKAIACLKSIEIDAAKKQLLQEFAFWLMQRKV